MKYQVIRAFRDQTDDNRLYKVGDEYPAKGEKPTKTRIKELLNGTNKNGKIYLKEVPDEVPDEAPAAPAEQTEAPAAEGQAQE